MKLALSISRPRRWIFILAILVGLAWFCWLMLRITLQYWPIRDDAAFLQIKQQYLGIRPWKIAFFIHVFTSVFALLAGFTQFAPAILKKRPAIHRWMGRLYVFDVCLVTGPASLIMAFFANGGLSSRLAFSILAVSWMATTTVAWRAVLHRRWATHRDWMIRSYALTLSAITLRIWKYLIVMAFHPAPMDAYRMVAWLGFIPNILAAEWIIRNQRWMKRS